MVLLLLWWMLRHWGSWCNHRDVVLPFGSSGCNSDMCSLGLWAGFVVFLVLLAAGCIVGVSFSRVCVSSVFLCY